MAQVTITLSASNPGGSTTQTIVVVQQLPPTLSASISPTTGPVGTTYTVTAIVNDPNTPPLTDTVTGTRSDGGVMTPVAGQPAGTYKWTTVI